MGELYKTYLLLYSMRISYSSLETFETCPLKFKLQIIDKIKTPKSKEAIFGTLIHDTLKMFHQPSWVVPPTEDQLLKYFSQQWNPSIFNNQSEEIAFFHQGVQILKNYYVKNCAQQFNIIDLETSFEVSLSSDTETHLITGKIDRIDKLADDHFEIIDYKTAKKMPSQKMVDDNAQLAIYHLGVINRWPALKNKPIKLSLYFLKHGEKISTFRTADNINQTKEKILTAIDKIQQCISHNQFDPHPNALCNWCNYQPHCPFFRHKYRLADQPTADEQKIKSLIDEYLELKTQSDKLADKMNEIKEIINVYCDKENAERVFGDKGYITRSRQQRFSYDYDQLRQILEPLGKWNDVLDIDSAKLKMVIRVLPAEITKKIEEAKKLSREYKVLSVRFSKEHNLPEQSPKN